MKQYILSFFILLSIVAQAQTQQISPEKKLVYKISILDIDESIGPMYSRLVDKSMEEAKAKKADAILVHLNTYGGAVDAADKIRNALLNSPVPVYVFVDDNAASAGALISIACDSIYMRPGGSIGAATVVNGEGEVVPDKYQSYMRSKMRSTAETNHRDPKIAEAMVDPSIYIPGIIDSGKVLTFTSDEALQHNFCDAVVNNYDEALQHAGLSNYTIIEYQATSIDAIINFLINPALQGILILVIIGGIYFELQTPGIGFPLIAAITAAVLYFTPVYLEGLAENWEILLFIGGIALLALEIFVIPGFGIAGISGIVLIIGGLSLSIVGNNGFEFSPMNLDTLMWSMLWITGVAFLSFIGSIVVGSKLLGMGMFGKFVLSETQQKEAGYIGVEVASVSLLGKTGTAITPLLPGGKIDVEGNAYDATAESGFIEKGEAVIVVGQSTFSLVVKKAI